jgi:hypothetical protein
MQPEWAYRNGNYVIIRNVINKRISPSSRHVIGHFWQLSLLCHARHILLSPTTIIHQSAPIPPIANAHHGPSMGGVELPWRRRWIRRHRPHRQPLDATSTPSSIPPDSRPRTCHVDCRGPPRQRPRPHRLRHTRAQYRARCHVDSQPPSSQPHNLAPPLFEGCGQVFDLATSSYRPRHSPTDEDEDAR